MQWDNVVPFGEQVHRHSYHTSVLIPRSIGNQRRKKLICSAWLDLGNANGSIPQNIGELSYSVPIERLFRRDQDEIHNWILYHSMKKIKWESWNGGKPSRGPLLSGVRQPPHQGTYGWHDDDNRTNYWEEMDFKRTNRPGWNLNYVQEFDIENKVKIETLQVREKSGEMPWKIARCHSSRQGKYGEVLHQLAIN